MSYSEENGQVILTMSRDDYDRLLFRLAKAAASMGRQGLDAELQYSDRLNSGNPNYTPYHVGEKK